MVTLSLVQSFALVLALNFANVYSKLDKESYRIFNSTTSARADNISDNMGALVSSIVDESGRLDDTLENIAERTGISESEFYLHNDIYTEAALEATDTILTLLQTNTISGAFMILEGSNADKTDPNAHSAVYIRSANPERSYLSYDSYQIELGPIAISQKHGIATTLNWDLDIFLDPDDETLMSIYKLPQQVAAAHTNAEISRYGYWSAPASLLGDIRQSVYYTVPLLDSSGNSFGIIGVEISLAHFTQYFLPNTDLPYENSFFAVTLLKSDNQLDLDWCIPSGALASAYLQDATEIVLEPVSANGVYSTDIDGFGEAYCAMQELTMYSSNSPFYADRWAIVGFVPQATLHETSSSVRTQLMVSIITVTVIALAMIFVMIRITTHKISGLSKYVEGLSPTQEVNFTRTGMREIDELTAALSVLNRGIRSAYRSTSKILELAPLPIGGYEMANGAKHVSPSAFICSLIGIPKDSSLTREEWEGKFAELTAKPSGEYESTYLYPDPMLGGELWLRILTTQTEDGEIGIVLDVTQDISEHLRLAQELDHDALTRLYNRVAFKRRSHLKIQAEPNKIGAMIFSDLDNLKYMNDTFGHEMGDRLIIRAGEMFRTFEEHGAVVARISGDEFAIYIHGFDSENELREIIDRKFRDNINVSLRTPDGQVQRVRFSSGIAWYPKDSDNVTDLLKLSDFAMYEAKHNSKGATFEFNPQSYEQNSYLLDNRETINSLLDEGLIRFAFQPIVDLQTGNVFAYELLMRSMVEAFKSPMEILSVAKAQSKLGELERLVVHKALETLHESAGHLPGTRFFINSIPGQVLPTDEVETLRQKYPEIMRHVMVEFTETETHSTQQIQNKIQSLRNWGMGIAIDDYGSGYSNEVRVLAAEPDVVKIDMDMIQGISQNEAKRELVENIVGFCHSRDILIVAEGVEEYDDLAAIKRLGIDFVQGYYVGRPDFEFTEPSEDIKQQIRDIK